MILKTLIFFFLILFTVVYATDLILRLPYESGEIFVITQGYNSSTHQNKDFYALDFSQNGCEAYKKPVLAVADGKIKSTQISDKGYGN